MTFSRCSLTYPSMALMIVDTVTSFGAVPFPIDEWQADIVATAHESFDASSRLILCLFGPTRLGSSQIVQNAALYISMQQV